MTLAQMLDLVAMDTSSMATRPSVPDALEDSLLRVRDLARWHCVCHLLGYPPLRLVTDA